MQYGYYILSSTNPDNYNKISANIQFPFDCKGEVKMTVYTLNTICNIETLNEEDYIQVIYDDELYTLKIDKAYSKLSPQTMPYIFNELFQKNNLDIICDIDQLDILSFTSHVNFSFEHMTYNLILLTGFYYNNFEGYYEQPVSTTTIIDNTKPKEITMTNITFADTLCNTKQWCIPKTFITPADANSQVYVMANGIPKEIEVIKDNGRFYYHPTKHGEYEIPVRIKNGNRVLDYMFKLTAVDTNNDITTTAIHIYDFPKTIVAGIKYEFSYNFEPVDSFTNDIYLILGGEYNEEVHAEYEFKNGYCSITFDEEYAMDNITMMIKKDYQTLCTYKFNVLPITSIIPTYTIKAKCVGFTLSTPILYLISNVGGKTFRNENSKVIEMQSCNSVMIINNASTPSFPIVAENTTIYTEVDTKDMTKLEFELVDANMKPIKLLNPMYICMMLEPLQRNETQELLEAFKAYDKKTEEAEKKAKELTINQNTLGLNDWKFYEQVADDSRYSLFRVNEGMKFD